MYSAVVLLFYIFTVATMDYEKLILFHKLVILFNIISITRSRAHPHGAR